MRKSSWTTRWIPVWCVLAFACAGDLPPPPAAASDPDYLVAIESWRAERDERLRRPDGWLSLAGLYWLEEGDNSFGSGAGNDLVFPEGKAATRLGVLHRSGREVRLVADPGAEITHEGQPVSELDLASDAAGEPTVLEHRRLIIYLLERGDRLALRLKDRDSELLRTFTGMDRYPVAPEWRLEARFEPWAEPRKVTVPNVIGEPSEQASYGDVVFTAAGREFRLAPLGEPDGELFLVFGDETNGDETYGGGRFLYAGPPDASGRLVVDFNKAYNPPCVFTPYATCPLPPAGNRLPLAVRAGEKSFGAHP